MHQKGNMSEVFHPKSLLPLQIDKLQFSNVPKKQTKKKKACTKVNPNAAFKIQYVKPPPSIKINFWCPYTFLPIF